MMEDRLTKVLANHTIGPGIHCLWVDSPSVAESRTPGEFVMAECGDTSDPLLRRAISIHRYGPDLLAADASLASDWITPDSTALLFNAGSPARNWLANRVAGDEFRMLGPLGRGYSIDPSAQRVVMGGGGTGLAPLIALADQAVASGKDVTIVSAARKASLLYPRDWIPEGVTVVEVTEDGSAGETGLITEALPRIMQSADQAFFCGPVPMYRAIWDTWRSQGISAPTQVLLEVRMACGFGICYGCAVATNAGRKMVCTQGPMFDLAEVNWTEL